MIPNLDLYYATTKKLWDIQNFDFVTPLEHISEADIFILGNGQLINKPIKVHKYAREQECHAITALAWLKNKNLKVHAGFAYSNGGWYYHSFCTNSRGYIVEPTTFVRDLYFGIPLNHAQTQKMVNDELPNLKRLGFEVEYDKQIFQNSLEMN